jgi:potassium channel subfamily K
MNDPGLDEPAQQAAQDVEKNNEHEKDQAEEEEEDFLEPRQVFALLSQE